MRKKLTTLLALAAVAVMTVALVGCDDDEDSYTAYFFEGYWEGQMGSYFYDELGYGTDYYYSQLDIVRTDEYGGRGQERDYNGNSTYRSMTFTWEVNRGLIYFHYDNGAEVVLDFTSNGDDRMYAQVYNTYTGEAVGTAELYRIDTWYSTWYDDPYWAKPNTWIGEEMEAPSAPRRFLDAE